VNRIIREISCGTVLTLVVSSWAFADPVLDDMSISKPLPIPKVQQEAKQEVIYRYKQSMSPRVGIVLDPKTSTDKRKIPFSFGFAFLFPSSKPTHWEFAADVLTSSEGQIEVSRRTIIDEMYSLRPYYRYGAFLRIKPEGQLASFTEIKQYGATAAFGIEDLVQKPASIRIEFEAGIGFKHQFAMLTFGYSWGWGL